jgi:hypothetical protein
MFEAANRIMTDLVMLNGVRWLLKSDVFPFQSYSVEYGHEAQQEHDIIAQGSGETLIGEAFNVAACFFATKRNATFKKLRQSTVPALYRMIMCNEDAVRPTYVPTLHEGEFFLLVNVDSGTARVVPDKALHPTAAGAIMSRRG